MSLNFQGTYQEQPGIRPPSRATPRQPTIPEHLFDTLKHKKPWGLELLWRGGGGLKITKNGYII